MKKILIGFVVLLIVAAFVILNLKKGGEEAGKTVFFDTVKRGKIVTKVSAEGEIRARVQVDISSDVMGRIEKFYVDVGDSVKTGQKLLKIEAGTYEAKVKRQRAILEADIARLSNLEYSYRRAKKLFKKGVIPEAEFQDVESRFRAQVAQVKADSFLLEQFLEDLRKTLIKSPIDGIVLSRNKEEGEMVVVGTMNTPGTVIMTLANLSEILVKAEVDETEIVGIKEGDPVEITVDAMPDSVFHGVVTSIGGYPKLSSTGSETSVTYPVEISIEGGSHGLLPGMSASCEIIVDTRENALKVPISAIGTRKIDGVERDVVFVYKNGIAHLTPIKTGISDDRFAEVTEGLSEGDTILTGPFRILKRLKDGEKVKITKRKEYFGKK